MTTIAVWICVCADDWAAELAVKASNATTAIVILTAPREIFFVRGIISSKASVLFKIVY